MAVINFSALWSPSEVEWCETKYTVVPHIAEFWNTITGIPYVLFALWNIARARDAWKRIMWVQVLCIGLGTSAFHGTLTLGGQLLDEISIVMFLATAASILFRMSRNVSLAIHAHAILLMFIAPKWNHYSLFVAGFSVVAPLIRQYNMGRQRQQILTIFSLTCSAIVCWVLDKFYCIGFGYLHSVWHIIMLIVIVRLIDIVESHTQEKIY